MKMKSIVIDDNVAEVVSVNDDDNEDIDVPIICLDDEEDDDFKINKEYKLFLDHLKDDDSLGLIFELNQGDSDCSLRYEADNGRSETRKFDSFSGDSKRLKIKNENLLVSQQSKRGTFGFKAENSKVRESIQRDNRVAERRKRKFAALEAARASPPLVRSNQESIRQGHKVKELEAETLGDAQGEIQRDDNVSQGRKMKACELKAETLRKAASLVRTEEDIQRDNKIAETKDVSDASMEVNDVNETSRIAQVIQRNNGVFAGRRNNSEEEIVVIVDKDYMSYLKWLVDSLKDLITKPTSKDQNDLDPPILDTLKESTTMVPEEDELVNVKVEQDLESLADDSDVIVVGDSPFFDGEGTPFVSSKTVINIDPDKESKEGESSSCWFKKELMKDLKRPYNEAELVKLYREASIHRKMTRCRELRKGRESDYETDVLGKSYLERFDDLNKVYKQVHCSDKVRALKLLRGFFFYLKNVSHDGSFKPWVD